MNIEKRLRALRQARKLRPILPFHAFSITGIDVCSDKYLEIQAMIKQLFKALKCQFFDIQINHWGEIHTVEPKTGIRVTIEVCTCPKKEVTYPLLKSISDDHYLSLAHNEDLLPILRLRYRALRPGTKWHSKAVVTLAHGPLENYQLLSEEITKRVSTLSKTVRREYHQDFFRVTYDDVFALIRYCAASPGTHNNLSALLSFEATHYADKCRIKHNEITLYHRHFDSYSYPLPKPCLTMLTLLLGTNTDTDMMYER